MRCPACDTECVERARYCHLCGAALPFPGSAESNPGAERGADESVSLAMRRLLPGSYADRLVAGRGRVEGERRVVTMLFSDVKGSTALAENLDPEDVLEIMNGAFEELIAPISRYGGTLARLMGDAILAFFGAPASHEDDPERACRAALEIVEGIGRYASRLERERGIRGFNVRVGINTGLVVVAEVGTELRVEYTAMGDAVNIAARMEAAAEPGTVLITEATRRLVTRAFETRALDPIVVKGKLKPVKAYRLIRLVPSPETGGTGRPGEPHLPFVGREPELATLRGTIRRLEKGAGARIALTGEAGVGKSRLIAEARPTAAAGVRWIGCRGMEYARTTSYWIARNLLCGLVDAKVDASPAELGNALRLRIDRLRPSQANDFHPYLCLLFNLPLEAPIKTQFDRMRPDAVRQNGFLAFRDFIRISSLERPLGIVWEDLQCVDRPSLELLEFVLPLPDECPLLLIMAYRRETDQIEAFHSRMLAAYGDAVRAIDLERLSRPTSAALLDGFLGGRALPESTRDQILDKTEGNALFLEEVVCSLMEPGAAPPAEGGFRVPDTLRGIIMSRIDRLGVEERNVLETASVLGRIFRKNAVARMIDASCVDRPLEQLQRRNFICPSGAGPDGGTGGDDEYMFRQSLARDVAYNTLLVSRRKTLHARAGEALEQLFPKLLDDQSAALASHFESAGLNDKALTYLVRAGRRAKQGFANGEAIDFFTRALKLAQETGADPSRVAEIHEALGDVYALGARYASASEQYEQAARGRPGVNAQAVLQRKMGQVNERRGLYNRALECYRAALAGLQEDFDPVEAGHVRMGLGLVYFRLGRLTEAVKMCERALGGMERENNAWGIAEACNSLGIIHCRGGDLERALGYHQRCLSLWSDLGNACGLAASHNNLGQVYHQREEWSKANDHYRLSLDLCEKTGDRHGLARTHDNLGQVFASQGQLELASTHTGKAAKILSEIDAENSDIVPEMWQQSGVW